MPKEVVYEGNFTNVAFNSLVLSWQSGDVEGLQKDDQDPKQTWKVEEATTAGDSKLVIPATIRNVGSSTYLGYDGKGLISSDKLFTWHLIWNSEDGTIGIQVPDGPTLELPLGEPGTKVILVLNKGDLTDKQKWRPIYWN